MPDKWHGSKNCYLRRSVYLPYTHTHWPFSCARNSLGVIELYYGTVLGTLFFGGGGSEFDPKKQSHSAIRDSNDPVSRTTSKWPITLVVLADSLFVFCKV